MRRERRRPGREGPSEDGVDMGFINGKLKLEKGTDEAYTGLLWCEPRRNGGRGRVRTIDERKKEGECLVNKVDSVFIDMNKNTS